jgi:hypothetical protein
MPVHKAFKEGLACVEHLVTGYGRALALGLDRARKILKRPWQDSSCFWLVYVFQ